MVLWQCQFCSDVLTMEAALQLSLWHEGKRSSTALLTPEEEERLRALGMDLLNSAEHAQYYVEDGKDVPIAELYDYVEEKRSHFFSLPSNSNLSQGQSTSSSPHDGEAKQKKEGGSRPTGLRSGTQYRF
jgi:hypothetical protein